VDASAEVRDECAILARGEIVFGSELAAAKGSAMIDRAPAKLKAAGYGQPG
jgi:hypothetical protein